MAIKVIKKLDEGAMPDLMEYIVTSGQTVTKGDLVHIAATGTVTPSTAAAAKFDHQYAGATTYPTKAATALGVAQATVVGDGVKKVLVAPIMQNSVVESKYNTGTPVVGDFVELNGAAGSHGFIKAAGTNPAVGIVIQTIDPQTGLKVSGVATGTVQVRIL